METDYTVAPLNCSNISHKRERERAIWKIQQLKILRYRVRTFGCILSPCEIAEQNFSPGISLSLAMRSYYHSSIADVHVHIFPAINKVDPFSGGGYAEEGGARGQSALCIPTQWRRSLYNEVAVATYQLAVLHGDSYRVRAVAFSRSFAKKQLLNCKKKISLRGREILKYLACVLIFPNLSSYARDVYRFLCVLQSINSSRAS